MGGLWSSIKALFWSQRLEIVLIGLENSGKSTFCNCLSFGPSDVEEPPTVGLNVKVLKRNNVTCKIWDIGGQEKYRSEWYRYAKGCNVIAFVIDTQAPEKLPTCKKELHTLLENPDLQRLPLLILANKIDLGPKVSEQELIKGLNLDYIVDNPWVVMPISAKTGSNVDKALQFLIKQADTAPAS